LPATVETDPHRWISVLRASQQRLHTLVGARSPADLRAQSYDTEWTVAQVLSHLGSQAEIFGTFLDAALTGHTPPGNDSFPPIWDAWNKRDPDEQARDCLATNDAFIARLEGMSDAQLAESIKVFGMDLLVGDLGRLRVSEHAVHSWDIAVVFDPTATVAPDAVALLIDTLPQVVARAGKPQGVAVDLHVETTAPERHFALTINDSVTLRPSAERASDGSLELPAEALLRLVYGRLDEAHTPPVARTFGAVTLDRLRRVFPGF